METCNACDEQTPFNFGSHFEDYNLLCPFCRAIAVDDLGHDMAEPLGQAAREVIAALRADYETEAYIAA
jgi:hypothetical protein